MSTISGWALARSYAVRADHLGTRPGHRSLVKNDPLRLNYSRRATTRELGTSGAAQPHNVGRRCEIHSSQRDVAHHCRGNFRRGRAPARRRHSGDHCCVGLWCVLVCSPLIGFSFVLFPEDPTGNTETLWIRRAWCSLGMRVDGLPPFPITCAFCSPFGHICILGNANRHLQRSPRIPGTLNVSQQRTPAEQSHPCD